MITGAKDVFFKRINELFRKKTPFFFLTDYHCQKMEITPLAELQAEHESLSSAAGVHFQAPRLNFGPNLPVTDKTLLWNKHPMSFARYKKAFNTVKEGLQKGNSYLTNLTCSTPVETNYSLSELFSAGQAKYKLLYRDQFINFSPEPFIRIENGRISSFPMKGTIEDKDIQAAARLMGSEKEIAEQYTITDLIRNDLYQVASSVNVENFRYLEKLQTNENNLYTVSSHITGHLRAEFIGRPGDILCRMLPAGSITGAPKASTMALIKMAETHDRNYYTGVWGYYDGIVLDSCVIIRYLENTPEGFIFKSGGGITSLSDAYAEYLEMISKVYVPIP